MVGRALTLFATIFLAIASEYGLLGSSGDGWTDLTHLTLRAVDYEGRLRIGVAPDLITNQRYFPCLTRPLKFKIKGSVNLGLLPLRVRKLEPLNYPDELWKNKEFARIRQYIEMWESVEPEVSAKTCEDGAWCVPQDLEVGHYIIYLGKSLRDARNNIGGAAAFGFQICP